MLIKPAGPLAAPAVAGVDVAEAAPAPPPAPPANAAAPPDRVESVAPVDAPAAPEGVEAAYLRRVDEAFAAELSTLVSGDERLERLMSDDR